jgi:transketolase
MTLPLRELANAIRFLSLDAIHKANSGHPGMPLGMADIATVLWQEFLEHNPLNPKWLNRDRFILSNGHGSMLQYSLLHLTGYDLSIEDLKEFRQLHSKTPGHPEINQTPGIETTSGPLGQGLGNAIGMALAEKVLSATFNRPNFPIIDHYIYVFLGDGCLMEGISHEVCSLAGTHHLNKLIAFWDNNGISIDGEVKNWFTDNTPLRFRAYGWHVISDVDGHNPDQVRKAILEAKTIKDRPTFICCKTIIGFGAPNVCGTHDCHGTPFTDAEIKATRENLNWQYPPFVIRDEIYKAWDAREKGKNREKVWQDLFTHYEKQYPDLAKELMRRLNRTLPSDWINKTTQELSKINSKPKALATRQASQNCLEFFGPMLPELFGGSADLTPSNLTNWSGSHDFDNNNPAGNYLHYGVREFGMFAIMSGLAIYGGLIPYGGTFLVFTSYGQSALRMAAMMQQRVIYILSHDSIGLGEDGPTHQPIEQLTMLRATPNLSVWRPADEIETFIAWQAAIERMDGPTCLVLTRQKVPAEKHDPKNLADIKRGGYILVDSTSEPDCIIIATGSEVGLAVKALALLEKTNKKIRLVSMPSVDVFETQENSYKESVLPKHITKRLVIETAASAFWYKYAGLDGKVLGIDRYGESAPMQEIFALLGFTEENIAQLVIELLNP